MTGALESFNVGGVRANFEFQLAQVATSPSRTKIY